MKQTKMSKNNDKDLVIKTDKRNYYAEDKIQTNVHCMVHIIQAVMTDVLKSYCNDVEFKVVVDKAMREEFMASMAKYSNMIPVSDPPTSSREHLAELLCDVSQEFLKLYLKLGWFDAVSEQEVDAVPVVRCKDCAYYEECLDTYMIPADCCPQGKRKEKTEC